MLTGDETRSAGGANLMGFDLSLERSDFLRRIGYCPQFDSIIEVLTGREMLTLFGRLRALPPAAVAEEAQYWINVLGEILSPT